MDFRDREKPDKWTIFWLLWAVGVALLWILVVLAAVYTYFWRLG